MPDLNLLILSDFFRGSYKVVGELYHKMLSPILETEHHPTPRCREERKELSIRFSGFIVLHNTLGEGFVPIKNCYNIAMPFHEWSEYPTNWIGLLDKFAEVWTTTNHVQDLLLRGGLSVPVHKLPPALDSENISVKESYEKKDIHRFFFVGEPHFRKGHHLLMNGYMKAFPIANEALLTIKTSPSCEWESPRKDIILVKEHWDRKHLIEEYSKHDCFVSASLAEGLGLPIAEAIMAKLPVCTNYWGGHKSLLKKETFLEVTHREIPQPFTSDPKFYAEGQKCAYSSPSAIRKALLKFLALNSEQKQKMTSAAKENFLKIYGSEFAKNNIQNRLKEIQKNL